MNQSKKRALKRKKENIITKLNNTRSGIVDRLFSYLNQHEVSLAICKTNGKKRIVHNLVELAYTDDTIASIVLSFLEKKHDRNSPLQQPVVVKWNRNTGDHVPFFYKEYQDPDLSLIHI